MTSSVATQPGIDDDPPGGWPPDGPDVDEPVEPPPADPAGDRRDRVVRNLVDAAVVLACAAFVFFQLHPRLILSAAVPAGGDMGAHVWGPAYLRDHLLPDLRVSGWTPDWYAGFPA
ncbi:MAG: hypothetical protein AB7L84_06690, partial [Acidimicrobiia bacterium]